MAASFRVNHIDNSLYVSVTPDPIYEYYRIRVYPSNDPSNVILNTVRRLTTSTSTAVAIEQSVEYTIEVGCCYTSDGVVDVWLEPKTYTNEQFYYVRIVYDANGGVGCPEPLLIKNRDSTITHTFSKDEVPSRYGHYFLGWALVDTADKPIFGPNDTISINSSNTYEYNPYEVTLYAVWTKQEIPTIPVPNDIDWTQSMSHTYEFCLVDPDTWGDSAIIDTVTKCSIERDRTVQTLGSATMDCTENLGECYIRAYLVVNQNGFTKREPLGTFLVQTPSISFDGKSASVSLDAYTPLIELKGTMPPIGYSLLKGQNIMDAAYMICRENMRAPVVKTFTSDTLEDNFISNLNDTWLSFTDDLIANAEFRFGLDEMSRVMFEPEQDIASLRSVWVYDDSNSSILYPSVTNERDLYGIPNVVEVVYTSSVGYKFSRVVNDDPNSPVSTVSRGREVVYRDSNPSFAGVPTQEQIDHYAIQLLRNLSCLEHKITYKHGYCPVRIGDCVTLNYKGAGLDNVRAQVISQSIDCVTGCPVSETAVYTTKLWR